MAGLIVNDVLHPKCGKRWTNNDTVGHCSACCETFYGLKAFEKHRRGGSCFSRADKLFWQDDKERWHYGERMSDEDKARVIKRESA